MPCQDIKTAVPVQGIVELEQVMEYGTEDHLTHVDDLLNKLCLKGGVPHSYPRTKAMQSVMELDGRRYLEIDDAGYRLSQDLHQDNPPEFGAYPLGYHHYRLPGAHHHEFYYPGFHLYDGDNLLPVPRVEVFLPLFRAKPQPEVFSPNY